METMLPVCTSINYFGSSIFSCMVKQKLGLTFTQGFLLGIVFCFLFCTGLVDKFFVSKEVFNLKYIYVDGKVYQLCRIK